ncbi:hypothetical protein [Capsulimonas corticalis]|uniref:hypothetical protein n=1 Tax=Capsulimonas corticalis TaxID=2219043 RepID=UPI000E65134D|nr:hypothetical protein [Capsulimonas corticalis]
MGFTKKDTHIISLRNGQTFEWRLDREWHRKSHWIAVREHGALGQRLFINPYSLDFEPGQATIRNAICAAFRLGWAPADRKPPMHVKYDGTQYILAES